jgi:UDP-N-acetylmuramoyl-tripeptide--D-alanyl-D-alanine ligase
VTVALLTSLAALVLALFFAFRRSLIYLHIFQQEEYDGPRFLRWLVASRSFDRKLSLALLLIGAFQFAAEDVFPGFEFPLAAAVCFAVAALREADPRRASKKKLALTARATRILVGGMVLAALVGIASAAARQVLAWVVFVQLVPLCLVLANLLLSPAERMIQARYWREAHAKLGQLRPTVIGVTGSFGKTSVKHILGHILDMAGPTLITPGSVNTPMGVSRIIRERLDRQHRYFVVEMGAYGPGSIARLCRLAPPDFGVITAIGMAHYERFKSLDVVAEAKLELAEAVIARGGAMIVAEQALETATARAFAERHRDAFLLCGSGAAAPARLLEVRQDPDGVVVDLVWQGTPYTLRAPLFGLHHGINIVLAFATACRLGLDPKMCSIALRSTPQVAHRLEVKRQPGGWTLVDDSYNSNPVGFAGALAVLSTLRGEGGRRVLVTPGMVELGAAHDAEHARLGALAADCVDVLLPVRPDRIPSFVESFKERAAARGEIVPCADLAAALTWIEAHVKPKDVVLLENDLPDLYESRLRL